MQTFSSVEQSDDSSLVSHQSITMTACNNRGKKSYYTRCSSIIDASQKHRRHRKDEPLKISNQNLGSNSEFSVFRIT